MKKTLSLGFLVCILFICGCGSKVAEVRITPEKSKIKGANNTLQLTAGLLDEDGKPAEGPALVWFSENQEVATVDQTGKVTSVSSGSTTITASSGRITGEARVDVEVLGSIEISHPRIRLEIGQQRRIGYRLKSEKGGELRGYKFKFMSENPEFATVDDTGMVTAKAKGLATINVSVDSVMGSFLVAVPDPEKEGLESAPDYVPPEEMEEE